MFSERMQILLSPEQRRRLESEAKRRGMSVGSLVREAIDMRFHTYSQAERLRAFEELGRNRGGRFFTPQELNRMVEEEREENVPLLPQRKR